MRSRDDLHIEVPITDTVYVMFQLHKQKDGRYLADGQCIVKKDTEQTFPLSVHGFDTVDEAREVILDRAKKIVANSSWRTSWKGLMGMNVIIITMGLFLLVMSHSATLQMLLTGRLHKPGLLIFPVMMIAQGLAGLSHARTRRKADSM
jgi:hypothetical protein